MQIGQQAGNLPNTKIKIQCFEFLSAGQKLNKMTQRRDCANYSTDMKLGTNQGTVITFL